MLFLHWAWLRESFGQLKILNPPSEGKELESLAIFESIYQDTNGNSKQI